MTAPWSQAVFVYGTLRDVSLLYRVLKHEVPVKTATLKGWERKYDKQGRPYLIPAGGIMPGVVKGFVFDATPTDLKALDDWEEKYERIKVKLTNGQLAWAYELGGH